MSSGLMNDFRQTKKTVKHKHPFPLPQPNNGSGAVFFILCSLFIEKMV